jgi:hypothetical protein
VRKLLMIVSLAAGGCASVPFNDGQQVVVEVDAWTSIESAHETALQACAAAGKSAATHVLTTSKNPAIPVGSGVKLVTFRCS